jgi:hypothetical protein
MHLAKRPHCGRNQLGAVDRSRARKRESTIGLPCPETSNCGRFVACALESSLN